MKSILGLALIAGALVFRPATAQNLKDVPAGHWARAEVEDVVSRGVLTAPDGKFGGAQRVTRRELAISLAKLAKSLEKGAWTRMGAAVPLKHNADQGSAEKLVTRYQLAWVFSRIARYVAAGLPKSTGKTYFLSVQLPPIPKVTIPKTDPSYESIVYLANSKMAPGSSPLLRAGNDPISGKQLAECMASMVAGLNDRLTDEPQNREEISPPPNRRQSDKR